jgi:23S rRNA pseudouridine1911/1915/1917 synthase
MSSTIPFEFLHAGAEERLDKIISARLSDQAKAPTRSQVKAAIERGEVRVNGFVVLKAGALVKTGSQVSISLPEEVSDRIVPYAFKLSVLYEDDEVVVIDKPAGISMHPGAGNASTTIVNALAAHFGPEQPELFREGVRPGIVHRLDKDTTGVVVVAKTSFSLARLAAQFARRTVGRTYRAVVFSTPRQQREIGRNDSGRIESLIGRSVRDRKKFAVLEVGGKKAITNWTVVERLGFAISLDVVLGTGRTHQIRVHMASIGSPIIGDKVYGDCSGLPMALQEAAETFGRQALHARSLEFVHPTLLKRLSFESALPSDLEGLIEAFRQYGNG